MYSASVWSFSSGPSWVSARIQDSLTERPQWAIMAPSLMVAPGRPFVHLLLHLADLGGKVVDSLTDIIKPSLSLVDRNRFRKGSRASSTQIA